jgi:hypothetical protein
MASHSSRNSGWQNFERLVAQLERILAAENAKVKLDDRVLSRQGQLRQVDATVRIKNGPTELLILLECRNRTRASDVTWIEQLATKREELRAAKVIVISNKRLSQAALKLALDKGIEVRTLRETKPEDLPAILQVLPKAIQFHVQAFQWKIVGFRFSATPETKAAINACMKKGRSPCTDPMQIQLTPETEFVDLIEAFKPQLWGDGTSFQDLKHDATKQIVVRGTIAIRVKAQTFQIEEVSVDFHLQVVTFSPKETTPFAYSVEDGASFAVAATTLSGAEGFPVLMTTEGDGSNFQIKIPPELFDGSLIPPH